MKAFFLCAILLLQLFLHNFAEGQTTAISNAVPVLQTTTNDLSQEIEHLKSRLDSDKKYNDLMADYKVLDEKVEENKKTTEVMVWIVGIFFGFFTLVFTAGTATSFVTWARAENRSKESHDWEGKAQGREESIFKQSQQTLTLVNETLGLAKEASARASKSLENKLKKSVKEYEKNSLKLIEESKAFEEDRNLVRQKEARSKIHSLGNKIKGLVNNIVILEDDTVELEPHCYFISGIDSHLREDYEDAIENLERAADHKDATQKLKSLAYYWLGYIHNNLCKFEEAARNFQKSLDAATGSREYEIRRITLETRFFNNEDGKELIKQFLILLRDLDEKYKMSQEKELNSRRIKIQNTLGNVYHQVGNETHEKNYYTLAKEQFESSLKSANPGTPEHMWVSFGLAEAKYKLGEKEAAAKILKEQVDEEAEKEFVAREELRTKVLAKTTQLICAVRSRPNDLKAIKGCRDAVISVIGDVDNRLSIYSQFQRRNVLKDAFLKEFYAFVDPILKTENPPENKVSS